MLDNLVSLCYTIIRQRKENIFDGGNTFRYFDCSNLRTPMYNVARVEEYGGEQFVLLRPEEDRSRKHYITERVLTGAEIAATRTPSPLRLIEAESLPPETYFFG